MDVRGELGGRRAVIVDYLWYLVVVLDLDAVGLSEDGGSDCKVKVTRICMIQGVVVGYIRKKKGIVGDVTVAHILSILILLTHVYLRRRPTEHKPG